MYSTAAAIPAPLSHRIMAPPAQGQRPRASVGGLRLLALVGGISFASVALMFAVRNSSGLTQQQSYHHSHLGDPAESDGGGTPADVRQVPRRVKAQRPTAQVRHQRNKGAVDGDASGRGGKTESPRCSATPRICEPRKACNCPGGLVRYGLGSEWSTWRWGQASDEPAMVCSSAAFELPAEASTVCGDTGCAWKHCECYPKDVVAGCASSADSAVSAAIASAKRATTSTAHRNGNRPPLSVAATATADADASLQVRQTEREPAEPKQSERVSEVKWVDDVDDDDEWGQEDEDEGGEEAEDQEEERAAFVREAPSPPKAAATASASDNVIGTIGEMEVNLHCPRQMQDGCTYALVGRGAQPPRAGQESKFHEGEEGREDWSNDGPFEGQEGGFLRGSMTGTTTVKGLDGSTDFDVFLSNGQDTWEWTVGPLQFSTQPRTEGNLWCRIPEFSLCTEDNDWCAELDKDKDASKSMQLHPHSMTATDILFQLTKATVDAMKIHGIKLELWDGSLLAAVRANKGVGYEITPWTGDADIGVPQDQYQRVMDLLRQVRTIHGIGFKFAQVAGSNFGRGCHNVYDAPARPFARTGKQQKNKFLFVDLYNDARTDAAAPLTSSIRGEAFLRRADAELYLAGMYGADWMTPDPEHLAGQHRRLLGRDANSSAT
eukprot:COSAG05_NODE_336_length_11205_cov_4.160544_5_plen_663_part_00